MSYFDLWDPQQPSSRCRHCGSPKTCSGRCVRCSSSPYVAIPYRASSHEGRNKLSLWMYILTSELSQSEEDAPTTQ